MGLQCKLQEDRRTDEQSEPMETNDEPVDANMQISVDKSGVILKSNDDSLSSSPLDVLTEVQPSSSSGYSANSTAAKKTEKKKLVQQRLNEIRKFLRSNSNLTDVQAKVNTLETLTQILELLKSSYSKFGDRTSELPPRLISPLCYNSNKFLELASDEDRDLLYHKFAVTIELSQPDGIILNVRFNNAHPDLSWIESMDLEGKLFTDLILSDDQQLHLLQLASIRNSSEHKCGYVKLKNPLNNVDRDSAHSTPCKSLFISTDGVDGAQLVVCTVIPLAAVWSDDLNSSTFFTKHSTDCLFIDVDRKVAVSWGYLPQELLGQSFLSFITDESCETFETSHELAIKSKGKPVCSNAYQFVIRNGSLITMKSEWSLFVNPWTKQVDFVIGCHNVIEGSRRGDMFSCTNQRPTYPSGKAHLVQAKINKLLSQPFAQKHKVKQMSNQNTSKVCKSDSSKQLDKQDLRADDTGSTLSKDKTPCRHMSTFFDRIVEHEYFMADTVPLHDEFWKKGSPQGSLPTSGDGSSGSPPESSGSGPSYNEITRLENVTRLLKSQEGHSSDDSSNEKCQKSASCSPVGEREAKPLESVPNSAILEALYNNPASVNMHRSHSAAANLDHCRQSVKLTSEVLQTFTKEQERQYKANWKRRFSVELQHVALKRALEPSIDVSNCNTQKISRPEVYRPASMPVIARPNDPYFYNPLTSPISTWSNPSPATSIPPVKSNSVNYYRSLGPTPAPPPGKNFQITSAPLPTDGFPVVVTEAPLSPRQSAFAPLKKLDSVSIVSNENWNYTTSGPAIQPINLSIRSDVPFQTSVIQAGSDGARPNWFNAPGASASVTLQRMTQTSRLVRENQWPMPTAPRPVPVSDDFLFRYQYNNNNSSYPAVMQNDQNRLFSMPQHTPINSQLYNENSLYSNQSYTSDVSPIREATESLMLLEEI